MNQIRRSITKTKDPNFLSLISLSLLILTTYSSSSTAAEPAKVIFAGGCLWCMEQPFDVLDGILDTTSGYTGGHVPDPDYKERSHGGPSGHLRPR